VTLTDAAGGADARRLEFLLWAGADPSTEVAGTVLANSTPLPEELFANNKTANVAIEVSRSW
jgi:hypothetical protein